MLSFSFRFRPRTIAGAANVADGHARQRLRELATRRTSELGASGVVHEAGSRWIGPVPTARPRGGRLIPLASQDGPIGGPSQAPRDLMW